MAEIKKHTKIENGYIMGYVQTNKVGSKCEFPICEVEEWEELTEEQASEIALEALWESMQVEWGY